MSKIDFTTLHEYFLYDANTGVFTRRKHSGSRARQGDIVGSYNDSGYLTVLFQGSRYKLHRLAWLYHYGVWPTYSIDHINGVRDDNRIVNLRDLPQLLNSQNTRRYNKTGYQGVKRVSENSWSARMTVCGKDVHIGSFPTAELASAAYLAAKATLHSATVLARHAGQNQDLDAETAAFIARMEHSFPHLAGDAE